MLSDADRGRLGENLAGIRQRIAEACARCGRAPEDVALVAVTKYAGVAYAQALLDLGQKDLGENRVDHLLELAAGVDPASGARWHMIGHLQRNKANKVADRLYALHSLESLDLARKLDDRRSPDLPPLRAYVQLGLDPDKAAGLQFDALQGFLRDVTGLTRIEIVGLMGLPPLGPAEEARPHFVRLRRALEETQGLSGLSMGMTSDLEVAVEEGATVVRIGRALLEGLSAEARA